MNRIATATVSALAAFTLAACGGGQEATNAEDTTPTVDDNQEAVTAVSDEEAEAWVKEQFGLGAEDSWEDADGEASSITGVRMDGTNMHVTMQVDADADTVEAQSVLDTLSEASETDPPTFDNELSWIAVEDESGTVVEETSVGT